MDQGRTVKAARDRARMTQSTLAQAAGVGRATVQRIEAGDPASHESVLAVCAVLGLDARDLVRAETVAAPAIPPPVRAVARATSSALRSIRALNLSASVVGGAGALMAYVAVRTAVEAEGLSALAYLNCAAPGGLALTGILSGVRPRAEHLTARKAAAYALFVFSGFLLLGLVTAAMTLVSASDAQDLPVGRARAFGGPPELWVGCVALTLVADLLVAAASAVPSAGLRSLFDEDEAPGAAAVA